MNRSLEVLKNIYKPYRYTIKGKATVLETTSGEFVIKPKDKDLNGLYNYLLSRNFNNFPNLIDSSRKDVNVFEYVEDIKMPLEQKCDDLIELIASLHNRTSYYKEVSEDTFKAIYEDIYANIIYLKNYYSSLYDLGFKEVYPSPSTYLFMRNYSKVAASIDFCETELEAWYELVKNETKTRVAMLHNNLELDHFIKADREILISWDHYKIDTPVLDLVNLYKKEYLKMNFEVILAKYLSLYPLLESEQKLLFILIALPPRMEEKSSEFLKCEEIEKMLDYVFKTENLLRPYYTHDEEEE